MFIVWLNGKKKLCFIKFPFFFLGLGDPTPNNAPSTNIVLGFSGWDETQLNLRMGFWVHNFYFFSHTLTFNGQFFFLLPPHPYYPLPLTFPCLPFFPVLFPFIIFSYFLWDLFSFILCWFSFTCFYLFYFIILCTFVWGLCDFVIFFFLFSYFILCFYLRFLWPLCFIWFWIFLFVCVCFEFCVCGALEEEERSSKKGRR